MATRSQSKIVLKQTKAGWRWVLVVRGKVVAGSASPFTAKARAKTAAESAARHMGAAAIVDE